MLFFLSPHPFHLLHTLPGVNIFFNWVSKWQCSWLRAISASYVKGWLGEGQMVWIWVTLASTHGEDRLVGNDHCTCMSSLQQLYSRMLDFFFSSPPSNGCTHLITIVVSFWSIWPIQYATGSAPSSLTQKKVPGDCCSSLWPRVSFVFQGCFF